MSVKGPVRRSTAAIRNVHASPMLSVTTGASDGSSPSWCKPSLAPGAYRLLITASGSYAPPASAPNVSVTARRAIADTWAGIGFTGAPSVSSANRL
jgi:hypothetical protein